MAPETMGHMTMGLFTAANSGADDTFCRSESHLGQSEGWMWRSWGVSEEDMRVTNRLREPVVWQRSMKDVLCPHLAHCFVF